MSKNKNHPPQGSDMDAGCHLQCMEWLTRGNRSCNLEAALGAIY